MDFEHICMHKMLEPLFFGNQRKILFIHLLRYVFLLSWIDITLKNLLAKQELQGRLDAWNVIIFIVATKQYWNNMLLMFEMSKKTIRSGETYGVDDQVNESSELWHET